MKFDMHVHTVISPCSQLTLEEILSSAGERGIDGVCITDHDSMEVRRFLQEGVQSNGLCVIFGMEYATPDGDFLIFGSFEEIRKNLTAPELLRHVQSSGGVAVSAHPFRANRSTREYLIHEGLCTIVEGINGRNLHVENDRVAAWQKRYGVKQVGGSDAHSREELGKISTIFKDTIRNRADFVSALKEGCFYPARNNQTTILPIPLHQAIAA
ncbi:MAG: PHP domain-containing protein [Proteobacteria bacterium]|nr:PHP domain-containing protein [Pseudomonadota bacterium]MBU1140753.1 PHP domain-containing protein [Pseudomonadota bacterium]